MTNRHKIRKCNETHFYSTPDSIISLRKFHDIYQTPFLDLLVPKNVIPVPDKWCYVYIFGSWLRANEPNLLFDEKSFYVCITDIILIFNHLFLFIALSLFASALEINIKILFYRILIVSLNFLFKSAFKNDLFVIYNSFS